MWKEYNPNPYRRRIGDCAVRSVCAVTGLPWRAVHAALCSLANDMGLMPENNRVWWDFLEGIGFRQIQLPDRCPDCYTVAEFAREHPTGRYILGPYKHAVAVIDGDWWDTWDSGDTVPYYYFYGGDSDAELPIPDKL